MLRKIGETQLDLRVPREANAQLGTIDTEKALREAYPGAIYRHCNQAFRVSKWRVTSYERAILLERVKGGARTHPMLANWVSASHDTAELFADCLLTGPSGSFAETCIQVAEPVEGYVLGTQQMTYRELNQTDRRKRRQYRRSAQRMYPSSCQRQPEIALFEVPLRADLNLHDKAAAAGWIH